MKNGVDESAQDIGAAVHGVMAIQARVEGHDITLPYDEDMLPATGSTRGILRSVFTSIRWVRLNMRGAISRTSTFLYSLPYSFH